MKCERLIGQDVQTRCPNEATETVLTPFGEFNLCPECAQLTRRAVQFYKAHEIPKSKTVLVVSDNPSIQLQALAHFVGQKLADAGYMDEVGELPKNIQN